LRNAIMFGAFMYFFIERDLFQESFLAIMLHGTLELSMIVMSGCAGFALSRGLLFPGTYTRGQALIFSARNGVRIMIGVVVLLVYAALIESFATRYTDLPNIENGKLIIDIIRGAVIALSFLLVFGYFVWYPWYRHKKGLTKVIINEEKANLQGMNISISEIKTAGRLFTETFILFGKNFRKIISFSSIASIIATILFSIYIKGNFQFLFNYDYSDNIGYVYYSFWSWSSLYIVTNFDHLFEMIIAIGLCSSSLIFFSSVISKYVLGKENKLKIGVSQITQTIIVSTILCLSLKLSFFAILTSILVFPLLILWYFIGYFEQTDLFRSIPRLFFLLRNGWGKMLGLFILVVSMQWIVLFISNEEIISFPIQFIEMNIPSTWDIARYSAQIIQVLLAYLILCIFFPLTIFSNALLYFSLVEINEAPYLKKSLDIIGFKKRAYGLEKEK